MYTRSVMPNKQNMLYVVGFWHSSAVPKIKFKNRNKTRQHKIKHGSIEVVGLLIRKQNKNNLGMDNIYLNY